MYYQGKPLYPFGHGLSYTTFGYGQPRIVKADEEVLQVSVPITNTGGIDGEEVVQLYVHYQSPVAEHPEQQLRAFDRVPIAAGQTREVTLTIDRADLSYWDADRHAFVPETGPVELRIGASSADIRCTCVVE